MFPVITATVLLLGAWLIFHFYVYDRIKDMRIDSYGLVYTVTMLALLFAGVFIFYAFREYVRYSHGFSVQAHGLLRIDGFVVYSLYRKKTVLGDVIALLVLFGVYELLSQACYLVIKKVQPAKAPAGDSEDGFNNAYLLLVLLLTAIGIFATIGAPLPIALWSHSSGTWFFWMGAAVLTVILQSILYTSLMPFAERKQSPEWFGSFAGYVAICLTGSLALCGAANKFAYLNGKMLIMSAVGVSVASLVTAYLRQSMYAENRSLARKVSVKSAELASLRSQVNPHFLFNALNSLYTAALKEGSERTADGIQKLGDMMRFMLHENNRDRILLEKETEYLHNYIQIQRIRIDESQGINIQVNIQPPVNNLHIAPMMLIPFVENAFKHGISHLRPSWIMINLSFDDTKLYFRVQNSVHPRHEADPEEEHSGVGLENVKKRLELIYPGRHQLEIQETAHDYFVSLTLMYW
ncbi:sensor protein lytS [Pedobacter sp. HMF7056]|uniref:Sensor protein lytS n=2 Tax=Hufsiella ginkgonis TaxID=2695274 RepID=A0A7K1XVN1_9SPHI|nr:sensor protein lytS [Hufsiella ginkgonis]